MVSKSQLISPVLKSSVALRFNKCLSAQATNLKLDNVDSVEWCRARPFEEIPGPTKYELIRGFMPGGPYYKKSLTDYLLKARQQYGDVYHIPGLLGQKPFIISFNVDDFQKIFRTEGVWPIRPGMESLDYYRKNYRADLYKNVEGLITSHGKEWGAFRTAVNPVLMQPRNTVSFVIPMQQVNTEFIERIREIRDPVTNEMPDNFLEEINRLTLESVAVVALNKQLGFIRKNRDKPEAKKLFNDLRVFLDLNFDLDGKPSLWKYIWTPTFGRFKKALDGIYDITTGYVEESLKKTESNQSHSTDDDRELSVLEKLLKIDKSIAIVMATDMLLAGVDTTSTVMSGILLQVAKNPDKQAELRKEIRQFLPKKDSTFTMESLKNLPYLRACIKEGIRMHPISPGIPRSTGEDVTLGGYRAPKGTQVVLCMNLLLRDERYFSRPNEFLPERWLRNVPAESLITPFSYFPFGFGPRMCVGKRIVDLELEVTVARLVRNFYIEFNYSIENAFKNSFVNTPAIPLKFKLTEVEN